MTEIINILNLKKKYDSILLETVWEKVKNKNIGGGGVLDSPRTIVEKLVVNNDKHITSYAYDVEIHVVTKLNLKII